MPAAALAWDSFDAKPMVRTLDGWCVVCVENEKERWTRTRLVTTHRPGHGDSDGDGDGRQAEPVPGTWDGHRVGKWIALIASDPAYRPSFALLISNSNQQVIKA